MMRSASLGEIWFAREEAVDMYKIALAARMERVQSLVSIVMVYDNVGVLVPSWSGARSKTKDRMVLRRGFGCDE